jgi:LDH2 family malate/lactate/ureidoglycolate dehydrogenase
MALLGIAANTSRAETAVAGGRTPVLGVNPVAFALPTLGEPLSADMSTTLAPMGVLWECRRAQEPLPAGCFVDADGRLTDDPEHAISAIVFGEHRGFALSLLLQALTGSVFGFPMGNEVTDTWTTGYTFIALDPAFANPDGQAAAANSRLVEQLRAAQSTDGGPLRLPSEHGRARAAATLAAGATDLPEQVLRRLQARADGDFTSD